MPPKKPSAKTAAKRGRGRPVEPDAISHDKPVQFRASADHKARWENGAADAGQSFSNWARDGLDAWLDVATRAAELEVKPLALLAEAFENHGRALAAVAELRATRTLSKTEERLLRILAPAEWARRFG